MSKDSYYFSHDSNAHTDPKIIDLLMDLKAEGYGVYWVILEMLRNENGYKLSNQDYNAIAYMAHSTAEVVEKVILNYNLFQVDLDGYFWSDSLIDRMKHLNAKREVLRINAIKRWNDAKAMQKHKPSEYSKVKESKVKESKVKVVFIPPSVEIVSVYCKERNNRVNPNWFVDFYASKGWMVGKNKMVDWKASVRNWEKKDGFKPREEPQVNYKPDPKKQEEVSRLIRQTVNNLKKE